MIMVVVLAAGCAQKAGHVETKPSSQAARAGDAEDSKDADPAKRWSLPRRLVDARNGAVLDPEAVYSDLMQTRVVYVSEHHNNPHHHAAQLGVIAGIFARDPSMAIGMEMFKRPFQGALDAYLAGEIDDEALLEKTEWEDRWGYSFELYRPILEFARAHRVPVYALNVPDEITQTVAGGGMKALSETERESLPDLDLTNSEYRTMIREVFDAHGAHSKASFEHFLLAQVIWDETMAYEVSRALKQDGAPKRMVVLAGDGHIRYGLGIPFRAARRGAAPYKIVIPVMARDLEETVGESAADYLWVMGMSEADLPAR